MRNVLVSTLAVAALAGSAVADVSYTNSVPLTNTNWQTGLSLPQWDPAQFPGEELFCVSLKLSASVDGRIRAESLDNEASTITASLSAQLTASAPSGLQVISLPLTNAVFFATQFDGSIDFGGTSGFDTGTLTGSDMDTNSLMLPADLSAYIGGGSIAVGLDAAGLSNVSGAGNIVSIINTAAAAELEITYKTRQIPGPGAAGLAGLGGLLLARRRR